MYNLFCYIGNVYRYKIPIHEVIGIDGSYFPCINDYDWTIIMNEEGAISEEGYVHGYIYDITAGEVAKEIYERTNCANIIGMILESGDIRMLEWNKQNKCYYGVEDNMII